jgi:hypothetical protein
LRDALIFIDTEFTAFKSPRMISAAFACLDGTDYYFELAEGAPNWTLSQCSDFVHTVVLPLRTETPVTFAHARAGLQAYLQALSEKYERAIFMCDYLGDWFLVHQLLDERSALPCQARLYASPTVESYDFGGRRHHALVDAQALRWAFQQDMGTL